MIDGRGIQRTVERAVHHVIALGAVLAAHILHHADVAAFDDYFGRIVVAVQDCAEMGAFGVAGERGGAVGSSREQNRSGLILCALRENDHGVQLHAVAHGNHYVALDVVEAGGDGREGGWRFAGQSGGCGGLG